MSRQEQRFVIGRAGECDVVLADPSVSRRHAELVLTPQGQWLLIDRQSQNGTSVQEGDRLRRIRQEVITPAAVLRFGDVTMPAGELIRGVQARMPTPPPARPPVPADGDGAAAPPAPGSPAPAKKPWVRGTRLIRCDCGAVKRKGATCPDCKE